MVGRSPRLEQLIGVFRKWLHFPDSGVIEMALATVAANRISGDPVWILLVGASSAGKTEVLNSLLGLPDMHAASTLSEAGLLSGTAKSERSKDATGGLLRHAGDFGILVLKDFTSILSSNREKLKALLAALREIYDGAWTRRLGVDGGREFQWQGKLGLIGGVTSAIDSHHSIMSSLGQRFALYRLPETDAYAQARRAINKIGDEAEMRAELTSAVTDFFQGVDFESPPVLSDADRSWIIALTTFVATCRSAVDRDAYSREIEYKHYAEAPARLTRMLAQLTRGALLIGILPSRARELLVKAGLDCIPPLRRIALEALLKQDNPLPLAEIAKASPYPAQTLRRALQDLECHGVVERLSRSNGADIWRVAPRWRLQFRIAKGPFPKC